MIDHSESKGKRRNRSPRKVINKRLYTFKRSIKPETIYRRGKFGDVEVVDDVCDSLGTVEEVVDN